MVAKPKDLKLKNALDRHKGVDHRLESQKRQQKKAEKRKRARSGNEKDDEVPEDAVAHAEEVAVTGKVAKGRSSKRAKLSPPEEDAEVDVAGEDGEAEGLEGWETDGDEDELAQSGLAELEDSETSDSDESAINGAADDQADGAEEDGQDDVDEDDEEDIPLSDIESLASEDKGDVIPHQRLTINNHAALLRAHKSIALSSKFRFSATQALTSSEPIVITDIEDDLNRELAFYKQSLDAVTQARSLLKAEGIPFARPADYFAEMVKSDEHMGKIKEKLMNEAAGKKASAEARKQRDLKKFGKQVQVAKLQERAKEKRDTMDKINQLKRSTYIPVGFSKRNMLILLQNDPVPKLPTQMKKTSSTSN